MGQEQTSIDLNFKRQNPNMQNFECTKGHQTPEVSGVNSRLEEMTYKHNFLYQRLLSKICDWA